MEHRASVEGGHGQQAVPSLHALRERYLRGSVTRDALETRLFRRLFNDEGRYRLFKGDRERWSDFVNWAYPRLSRAIDAYRDTGVTFDAYIGSLIGWAGKEYRAQETVREATEYACWKVLAEEDAATPREPPGCVAEAAPDYAAPDFPRRPPGALPATARRGLYTRRQILALFLKSYFFMEEEHFLYAELFTGVDRETLKEMVDRLRRLRAKREDRIGRLRERLHSQYYRCLLAEARRMRTLPGTASREVQSERVKRAWERLAAIKQRLAGERLNATHREIAEVMGVTKGTVDAYFAGIKRRTAAAQEAAAP